MNLIYGIVNFKSCNVVNYLNFLENGISCFQLEKKERWINVKCGLGTAKLFNKNNLSDQKPLKVGDLIITSNARIDNRDEILNSLNISNSFTPEISDSALIAKAYQKWGEDCVNHIHGEWAFAIWDEVKNELFLARDPLGNTAIFYYQSNESFIFCSSIKGILALSEISRTPNDIVLAGILTVYKPSGGQTVYKDVFEIEPGHFLTIKSKIIIKKRYWFIENTPELRYKSSDDYVEHFLELYQNAVDVRLKNGGKIGSTLSGGLDSGSVTSLAAKTLEKQDKQLFAYTAIPFSDVSFLDTNKRFANEKEYSIATAKKWHNIIHSFIQNENVSILDSINLMIDIQSAPIHGVGNCYWMVELFERAKSEGINTLLTGNGGNSTVSWAGIPQKRTFNENAKAVLDSKLSLNRFLKSTLNQFLPHDFISNRNLIRMSKKSEFSSINSSFFNEIKVSGYIREMHLENFGLKNNNLLVKRLRLLNPINSSFGTFWQNISHHYNLQVTDPTRDKKLVEFCFSIPDEFFLSKEYDRNLIRKSMKDLMPDEVRLNKKIGRQGGDSHFLIEKEIIEIKKILANFEKNTLILKYLNVNRMKHVLEKVNENASSSTSNELNSILLRGIGLGRFLQNN